MTTNVRLRGEGKYVTFEVSEKVNNPEHFSRQRGTQPPKENVENGEPREFKIHARLGFEWQHASIGDLKSAYIAAFAKFGYLYAFDRILDLVRERINSHPDTDLIQGACWIRPPEASSES